MYDYDICQLALSRALFNQMIENAPTIYICLVHEGDTYMFLTVKLGAEGGL